MVAGGRHDAVIALGAVIRGGTPHFEYVAGEATKGVAQVALEADCAVTMGVLTCDTMEQALERAGVKAGNKGAEAAMAAIEQAQVLQLAGRPARQGGARMTGRRTKARERALQALYQIDVAAAGIDDALASFWKSFEPTEREVQQLAEQLVRGVAVDRRQVDDLIENVSTNWRLDRMAKVDRNVLRLATWELLKSDAPVKVVINEAIELGKKYGSEQSGAFVNGVLDKVAQGLPAARRGEG